MIQILTQAGRSTEVKQKLYAAITASSPRWSRPERAGSSATSRTPRRTGRSAPAAPSTARATW
ncbi:hypothetical protein ACYF6T_01290 [Streptomyces sp. 7R007]